MAIDVFNETLLTLAEATRRMPAVAGRKCRPHLSTLHRWVLRGCTSRDRMIIRLETVKVGGTLCTSLEALQRFFDRLSGDTAVVAPPTLTQRQRRKRIEAAEQVLREAGI